MIFRGCEKSRGSWTPHPLASSHIHRFSHISERFSRTLSYCLFAFISGKTQNSCRIFVELASIPQTEPREVRSGRNELPTWKILLRLTEAGEAATSLPASHTHFQRRARGSDCKRETEHAALCGGDVKDVTGSKVLKIHYICIARCTQRGVTLFIIFFKL